MVSEVDQDAFGVHAERSGDSLGSMVLTGSAGAAQHPGRDAAWVRTWLV